MARTVTTNGAAAHTSTGNKLIDLFFNIGASRNNLEGIRKDFAAAFKQNPLKATAVLLYARDIRHNGIGERQVFRTLLKDLVSLSGEYATKTMYLIPEIARFDDLKSLYGTPLEASAARLWAAAITEQNVLAAKWAKREDKKLQKALGLNEAGLRKVLSALRAPHIPETKMCAGQWSEIDYSKLPSVCGARNAKAFGRNDADRYTAFINSKETKVNAAVAFPHDVYRMYRYGNERAAASKYWENLPALELAGNILPMADVSGSMMCPASGQITCLDVCVALSTYLSQRIEGKFQNTLLTFSESPTLVTLPKTNDIGTLFNFVERMNWGGNTNIQRAYEKVLQMAQNVGATQKDMPEYILIMSDMQFDQCTDIGGGMKYELVNGRYQYVSKQRNLTIYEHMAKKFEAAGFKLPKIVFWNLNAGYGNTPTTEFTTNTALISGFSANALKAVLAAKNCTPEAVMDEAIAPFIAMLQA